MYFNLKLTRSPMDECFHNFLKLLSSDQKTCVCVCVTERQGEGKGEREDREGYRKKEYLENP